ncbi:Hypothetical protein SCF082_LOCUS3485 [Durusdinium trenchii]|uniref:Dienelactone hydrolase domain-containing protein n=1 Tax=Durusdinium trenchii TaxID=1381693 RepID=A0ABP0HT61_9DINO
MVQQLPIKPEVNWDSLGFFGFCSGSRLERGDRSRSRIICGLGASCTPLLFAWTARALRGHEAVAQAQVQLNTWRSLGTFIGPFSSTVLCVLPKEGLFNELNSAGWAIALANIVGLLLCFRQGALVARGCLNRWINIRAVCRAAPRCTAACFGMALCSCCPADAEPLREMKDYKPKHEMTKIQSLNCYVAMPSAAATQGVIMFTASGIGFSRHKQFCDMLAGNGYLAVCPDFIGERPYMSSLSTPSHWD